MPLRMVTVVITGLRRGKIILKNVPSGEHPSIAAASSRLYGIPLIKPVKINTVMAPPKPR